MRVVVYTPMERAGRLLSKLKTDSIPADNLARTAWPKAVGKVISAHTQAGTLVRNRLVIDVEDVTWQRQLVPLSAQIVRKLEAVIGPGVVTDLEFRVAPLRIRPRRETVLPLFDLNPDLPGDPIFRHVYLLDRRRRALTA
jgi:Dna[CI] antecedent, DciA